MNSDSISRRQALQQAAMLLGGACVNPSITYMALTARACDYAVAELKRGNI